MPPCPRCPASSRAALTHPALACAPRWQIRIVEALKEILPSAWGERVGKTVDRVCSSGNLALAAI